MSGDAKTPAGDSTGLRKKIRQRGTARQEENGKSSGTTVDVAAAAVSAVGLVGSVLRTKITSSISFIDHP
jgi:hypothetical protein